MILPALAPSQSLGAPFLFGYAFLLYASISLAWSLDFKYGVILLASLAISYILGSIVRNHYRVWVIYVFALCANLLLCLHSDIPFGLFGNANYFGCALALGLAGAIAYRLWWFVPIGLSGVWYTQSRGAALAVAAVLFVALRRRSKALALLCFALIAISAAFLMRDIHGEFRINGLFARLGIWEVTLSHMSFFGSGFGSFFEAFDKFPIKINMTGIRAAHVYNDYLEMVFELGIGAVLLWVFLILSWSAADAKSRLVCVSFFVLALTYFPTHVPLVGQLFAFTLGKGEDNGKVAVEG